MSKNRNILINSVVCQGTGSIVSDMDGEKVMLNITNGKYYNLGDVGGDIWELIKNPLSVEQLVSILTSQYEVEQSECEEHVIPFLSLLAKEGLIEIEETAL